jgi:hypothetical protein
MEFMIPYYSPSLLGVNDAAVCCCGGSDVMTSMTVTLVPFKHEAVMLR